jgi:hypothetical protein
MDLLSIVLAIGLGSLVLNTVVCMAVSRDISTLGPVEKTLILSLETAIYHMLLVCFVSWSLILGVVLVRMIELALGWLPPLMGVN